MKKNLLLFFLLFVVGTMSSFADEWTDSDGNKWSFNITDNENHYVTLTGLISGDNATVPGSVFVNEVEYAVTSIGGGAFRDCSSLTSIGDLSACTSIGSYAFRDCSSLTSIGDLSACTSIGSYAFSGCSSLTSIGNLSACTSIGSYAFSGCSSLTSIGNLSACTSIGGSAFQNCSSLTSIGDLSAYTSIGGGAFQNCSSLTSIGDLSACTSIGGYAFYCCSSLTSIGDLSVCTSIGSDAFYGCSSLTSIGDLSACTSIGSEAFRGCSSLTSIGDLPACTSIGSQAFSGCAFTEISIGSGVTLENTNAFPECMTILVPEADVETYRTAEVWSDLAVRIISKDAQRDWDITITETPAVGSAVQNAIGESNLGNVTTLKITGDINSFDFFVMRNNMPNLHIIDLSDANIVASDYKYYSSYHTEDNIFPQYGFYQQNKLTQIKFPHSIKTIGRSALEECKNMSNIIMYPGIETIGDYAFRGCRGIRELIIPEGVTSLGNYACSDNGRPSMILFKRVVLPSSLKRIGDGCFNFGCQYLEDVNLPSGLEYIGNSAFRYCESIKEVTLPSSLTYIGSGAFSECSALRTIKATAIDPNSVEMSDNSFDNYSNKTLYLPFDEESGWDATYNAYYWHTQWGQFNTKLAWKPNYENVNIGGDYDQDKGTIPGVNIGANFGNNAGYHLGQLAQQGFDKIKIKHNGKDGASIIDDNNNLTVNELTCDITVAANKWYFFCFPFDVDLDEVTAPGESVWRKYDAAVRASNGTGGWKKLGNSEKTLSAGKGYIFQCNEAGTLVIRVENPDFNADNKSPQLEENVAANAQDASWNFIGNPYLSYYELEDLGHDAPVTIWNGSGYEAVRPGDDDYALYPFQAFFVQKTAGSDEVTVDKDKRETKNKSKNKGNNARMMRAQQMINPDRLLINLELTDGVTTDKTRVVFNNKHQMDYEPECDAAKFMSTEQVPQLYTYYNNVNYAINERPNSDAEVKLAFTAPKEGDYTISISRMDTPVLLRDAETGITFDFQAGSYTFHSKAGQFSQRFMLVKNNSETAIQPVTVGDAQNAMYFKLNGVKTDANAKGIIVSNGKKMLKK